MGIGNWFARKGNIGGTARAVAKGWITLKKQNPEMTPIEIANTYIEIRYGATREYDLNEQVVYKLAYEKIEGVVCKCDITPIGLSWRILKAENRDTIDTLYNNEIVWKEIMREEIKRLGLDPDDSW